MKLGEIIREYRLKYGMSMGDFAKLSGISKPYISMLEADKNSRDGKSIVPSVNTLQKVSRALDMTLNELFSMLDDEQNINVKRGYDEDELTWLNKYKGLDENNRQMVNTMITAFLSQQKTTPTTQFKNFANNNDGYIGSININR